MTPTLAQSAALSRIELELDRLASARQAVDRLSTDASTFGQATKAQLTLSVSTTENQLDGLARKVRRYGLTSSRQIDLENFKRATDRVVQECFALAMGLRARQDGLDGGACEEADRLIAELASTVDFKLARPTVPGDSEYLHRAADVIRRRLPDHGLWDLPAMAHEFGHLVMAHLQFWDPVNDKILAAGGSIVGGWPGCSDQQGEELACDVFAAHALGPAFACTQLLHRLVPAPGPHEKPPSTHPSDATRAAVLLEVLRVRCKPEPPISRLRGTASRLNEAWASLQQESASSENSSGPAFDAIRAKTRQVLDELETKLEPAQYNWRAADLADLAEVLGDGAQAPHLQYDIRDVLNAAWLRRLDNLAAHSGPAPEVASRAQALIAALPKKTGS